VTRPFDDLRRHRLGQMTAAQHREHDARVEAAKVKLLRRHRRPWWRLVRWADRRRGR